MGVRCFHRDPVRPRTRQPPEGRGRNIRGLVRRFRVLCILLASMCRDSDHPSLHCTALEFICRSIARAHPPSQAISFTDASTIAEKVKVLISGTNGVLLAALLSTYGLCAWLPFLTDSQADPSLGADVVSSILYLDPWHLITSFPAYIVRARSAPTKASVLLLARLPCSC